MVFVESRWSNDNFIALNPFNFSDESDFIWIVVIIIWVSGEFHLSPDWLIGSSVQIKFSISDSKNLVSVDWDGSITWLSMEYDVKFAIIWCGLGTSLNTSTIHKNVRSTEGGCGLFLSFLNFRRCEDQLTFNKNCGKFCGSLLVNKEVEALWDVDHFSSNWFLFSAPSGSIGIWADIQWFNVFI